MDEERLQDSAEDGRSVHPALCHWVNILSELLIELSNCVFVEG